MNTFSTGGIFTRCNTREERAESMYTDSREKRPDEARSDDCTEAQLETLLEAIACSQHNHRDLIDSLDQAVFTLSLEGEVRVANRRLAEILGVSFHELIGHRLSEFLDRPPWAEVERL